MTQRFLTGARIVWGAVGGRILILPTAAAGAVAFLGGPFGKIDVTEIQHIEIKWIVAGAILLLWLIGGLIKKAVSLQRRFDLDPEPDWSARDAFRHVMIYSKWALGRNPDDENYYEAVEGQLGDAARLGRIKVWVQPKAKFPGGFQERLREVTPKEWENLHFDLVSCATDATPSASVIDYSIDPWKEYVEAQVNRLQIFDIWPKAGRLEIWRDKDFDDRLKFHEKEKEGYV